jgi:hypothetical protein
MYYISYRSYIGGYAPLYADGHAPRRGTCLGSGRCLGRPAAGEACQPAAGWPSQCVNQERMRSRTSIWWARSVKTWFSRG